MELEKDFNKYLKACNISNDKLKNILCKVSTEEEITECVRNNRMC